MKCLLTTSTIIIAGITPLAAAGQSAHIDFENGWEGWTGMSGSQIVPTGGNPGAHVAESNSYFTLTYATTTNEAFLGDYTQYSSVTLSIDIKVNEISSFMGPQDRELFLELSNITGAPGEFISAWIKLGDLPGTGSDWTTYSITFDPNDLSGNWQGSDSGSPGLPDGFTLADVMERVEDARFTATEPGFNYVTHFFDMQMDNIRIEAALIPAPGAALALLGVFGVAGRRRRN